MLPATCTGTRVIGFTIHHRNVEIQTHHRQVVIRGDRDGVLIPGQPRKTFPNKVKVKDQSRTLGL